MVYEWKQNIYKTDAQIAGEVCEELEKTVGLTSQTLLDASRPDDAPLHNEFEWNDSKAAEKYREEQARHIICNLSVVSEVTEPTRAFVTLHTKVGEKSNYEPVIEVMKDGDKQKQLLEQAKRELGFFKTKYQTLIELAGVIREIDKL